MIEREVSHVSDLLVVRLTGELVSEDYIDFNTWADDIVKNHSGFKLLCIMDDFHGWAEFSAVWEDAKFGLRHRKNIERFAMIGDKRWEEWMLKIAKLFMPGQVKYFDVSNSDMARYWVETGK